ncbi:hypothetical protein Tco_0995595, partial [Tanacetum coccineum]
MGKGLLGPSGGSSGLIEGRLGERCGRNGGRNGSMSGLSRVEDLRGSQERLEERCGEVNGGGVDLGVSKRLEVAGEMIGESGGIEAREVGGGTET